MSDFLPSPPALRHGVIPPAAMRALAAIGILTTSVAFVGLHRGRCVGQSNATTVPPSRTGDTWLVNGDTGSVRPPLHAPVSRCIHHAAAVALKTPVVSPPLWILLVAFTARSMMMSSGT